MKVLATSAALFFLLACRKHDNSNSNGPVYAYTLSGTITLDAPLPANSIAALGSTLNILFFISNATGYCLQDASALAAAAYRVEATPNLSELTTTGVSYNVAVSPLPNQTYPITLYPVAVLQNTESFSDACFTSSDNTLLTNAIGYYGNPTRDVCCGGAPAPLIITEENQNIDADFVMTLAIPQAQGCAAPDATTNQGTCEYRYAADGATDSACWTALGANATELIHHADGTACD